MAGNGPCNARGMITGPQCYTVGAPGGVGGIATGITVNFRELCENNDAREGVLYILRPEKGTTGRAALDGVVRYKKGEGLVEVVYNTKVPIVVPKIRTILCDQDLHHLYNRRLHKLQAGKDVYLISLLCDVAQEADLLQRQKTTIFTPSVKGAKKRWREHARTEHSRPPQDEHEDNGEGRAVRRQQRGRCRKLSVEQCTAENAPVQVPLLRRARF